MEAQFAYCINLDVLLKNTYAKSCTGAINVKHYKWRITIT